MPNPLTPQDLEVIRLWAALAVQTSVSALLLQTVAAHVPQTRDTLASGLQHLKRVPDNWTLTGRPAEYSMLYAEAYQEEMSRVIQVLQAVLQETQPVPGA